MQNSHEFHSYEESLARPGHPAEGPAGLDGMCPGVEAALPSGADQQEALIKSDAACIFALPAVFINGIPQKFC